MKKVLYIILAVVVGFFVYAFSSVMIIADYQNKIIEEKVENEDYGFFLSMASKYNQNAVFESSEDAPIDLKIYKIYQEASGDNPADCGYMFIIFNVDTEKVMIEPTKNEEGRTVDNSSIKFYNELGKNVETNLYLSSYSYYGTIYPFMAYGVSQGINTLFGTFDDEGNLVSKADIETITRIELIDCNGNVFYSMGTTHEDEPETSYYDSNEFSLPVREYTKDAFLNEEGIVNGMSDAEIKAFNNPKSCIWKQALILSGYVLIAGGIGFLLFKHPNSYGKKRHASATEFTGSLSNEYDDLTKSAKEERKTITENSSIPEDKEDEVENKDVESNELDNTIEEKQEEVVDNNEEEKKDEI